MTSCLEACRVLHEQDGLLAVYKPAPLPTEPTDQRGESLVAVLSAERGGAPVHAASRLDVGVSGVLLCTTERRAAQRLQQLRRDGAIVRRYVGIVAGTLPASGTWTLPLGQVRDRAGRKKASAHARDTRPAKTDYRTIATIGGADAACLVVFRLHTGRFHQIRAHACAAGAPLFGDRRYGGPSLVTLADGRVLELDRIALHAAYLRVGNVLEAQAPFPATLTEWWQHLGGSPEAWSATQRHLRGR